MSLFAFPEIKFWLRLEPSEEEAETVFVQPQFPVINHCFIIIIIIIIIIITIIRNLYSAMMPLGGYRGAGGTGR